MPLNLISAPWIPVINTDGQRRVIAPWEMADRGILRLDWPRPDLNLACLELLIGLVFLADPPEDVDDWEDRRKPDPERLRNKLKDFAPAFNLTGEGPLFLQDLEPLEGTPNPPDMLFIDSAGGQTIKNNADLMVWRNRYPALDPALAAMALYTLQAFAPSGGAGNRTSMRGGGPLVTLMQPEDLLWPIIWANVPDGQPATMDVLPWMRPTVTSEKAQLVYPEQSHPAEAFFGMPRRLRLVETDGVIAGVIQRPWGTNYAGWDHPLSPYYRLKLTEGWLPKHPRAGQFGYRNWLGVVIAQEDETEGLQCRAYTVKTWAERGDQEARLLVAGWSMDNMKPRDFIQSTPPFVRLDDDRLICLSGMIIAAEEFGVALRGALAPVLAEGEAREAVREEFFQQTQADFETCLTDLTHGAEAGLVARKWISVLRQVGLRLFEAHALPGLSERNMTERENIVQSHRYLMRTFAGHSKNGKKAYGALLIEPATKQKAA